MATALALPVEVDADTYANSLRTLLWEQLFKVVHLRAPAVALLLGSPKNADQLADQDTGDFLQAVNIWFQLTKIVDENSAVRERRQTEALDGPAYIKAL